jgi:hypothetical protein
MIHPRHVLLLGLLAAGAASAGPYRVAVLGPPAPWAERLAERLAERGLLVRPVTAADLAEGPALAASCDALVVTDSPRAPAAACPAILAFAQAGGDLVLLGGRAFAEAGPAADEALRLEAFDDYEIYRLRAVCAVTRCPPGGEEVARGAFSGFSAVGFPELGAATFEPLLAAVDRHGRVRGWAAGTLIHHAGALAGSQWLLAGVEEAAFYESAAVQERFAEALCAFREGSLLARSRSACEAESARRPAPQPASASLAPLRIAGGHFVRPDGSRFFALGANFFNSFHTYYGGGAMWSLAELERDFQRMRRAGINAIRLHDAQRFLQEGRAEAFLGLCRSYGVRILPTAAAAHSGRSLEQLAAEARRKAARLGDEPLVIGFDLDNEPYWWELARLTAHGQRLGDRYPAPPGAWKAYQASLRLAPADWTTTFPGLWTPLPRPEQAEWRQAFDSANGIYGEWLKALTAGLRAGGSRHPVTVGYNTVYAALPANAGLDFLAHHVYEPPESLEQVRANVTTLDRLRAIWPGKPVLLGEFGYSNGDRVEGLPLGVHASSVGEMAHYLHALAGGFDGVLKWELCDADPAYQRRWLTWQQSLPEEKRLQQRRFGLFVYDGTPEGRAKPIAHATRFLRDWLDRHAPQGRLTLRPAGYPTGTAYTFEAEGARFVGDRSYAGDGLRFEADEPANVMLAWEEESLRNSLRAVQGGGSHG